MKAYYYYSELA